MAVTCVLYQVGLFSWKTLTYLCGNRAERALKERILSIVFVNFVQESLQMPTISPPF